MFTPDITLNDGTADQTFSLVAQRTSSSVRSDTSRGLTNPRFLSIAHETGKDGKISSVVYLDSNAVIACTSTCSTEAAKYDTNRAQFKLVRNPLSGRDDIDTESEILRTMLIAFLNNPTLWAKFLNQES